LNGAWVTDIDDVDFDTTKRSVSTVSVTFAYDFSVFKVL
jgi:hypothetical protein